MDKNMTLEKRIAAELYCYQGKMSVFVDDLQGHTVEVGADEEFETASTIKAFILAALYLQAQRGKADLAEEITYEQSQFVDGSGMLRALGVGAKLKVKDTATMMIICSDNIATNMIIDYLGLDTINACIRELGFAHTVLHNPLHFDRYRRLGTTTPRDYAALFARIAKGELVSREASAEMIAPALQGATLSDGQLKDGSKGIKIDSVEKSSPAAQAGLQKDDVIIGVNRDRVNSIAEMRKVLEAKPSIIALQIVRGNESIYLLLR